MSARRRGRPAGESKIREAITREARRQFGELGYGRTTLRGVAAAVGVDPRLVLHYFGSKERLFRESIELPVEPESLVEGLFEAGTADLGRRAADLVLTLLEQPATRDRITGFVRAAVAEPGAAAAIRGLLAERMLGPVAVRVGSTQPELRASMMATVVVGLVVARHIVALEPLAGAPRERLVAAIAPVIDHYLFGDWVEPDADVRGSLVSA